MRSSLPILALTFLALGCQSASNTPAIPGVDALSQSLPTYDLRAGEESLVAMFAVTVDPATMSATASPIRGAQAQPPQGQTYDLDIERFLTGDSLRIVGVGADDNGDFVITFQHSHPFRAPDVLLPPTAANRADLGYTGRVLLVTEDNLVPYFGGSVQVDPRTVLNADGYLQPGDLLNGISTASNAAYPYVLLADETEDNRIGISNGGNTRGNYAPGATGGWQRSNIGAFGQAWTGYDYLHGGQSIENSITLSTEAIGGSTTSLLAAILIKYTDPRGAGGPVNRLPAATVNVLDFAYRLPYAALDCGVIRIPTSIGISNELDTTTTLAFEVRDWDAKATEAGDSKVGDETDIALVQQGGSGIPSALFDCPALKPTTTPIAVVANARSGRAGSELQFSGTIANALGTASIGTHMGLVRLTDPEELDPNNDDYHAGVDAVTLAPDPVRRLKAITYQVIPITVALPPPVVSQVLPTGDVGVQGALQTFHVSASNAPTGWSWNFGGGTSPNLSSLEAPEVSLGAPGDYTGTITVSNGSGSSTPFSFDYTVAAVTAPPVVQSVSPSGVVGCPRGGEVTFSAIATNAPTSWLWNFGTGATPESSTDPTPTVTLLEPGTYSGSVVATNAAGNSNAFGFQYTVGGGWQSHVAIEGGGDQALELYGDKPIVVKGDASGGVLTISFFGSTSTIPSAASDWVTHDVSFPPTTKWDLDMVVVNDRILIIYLEDTRIRALVSNTTAPILPASPTDWTVHTIANITDSVFLHLDADVRDNKPVVLLSQTGIGTVYDSSVSVPDGTSDWGADGTFIANAGEYIPSIVAYQPQGASAPVWAALLGNSMEIEGQNDYNWTLSDDGLIAATGGPDPRLIIAEGVETFDGLRVAKQPIPTDMSDWDQLSAPIVNSRITDIAFDGNQLVFAAERGAVTDYLLFPRTSIPGSLSDWESESVGPTPDDGATMVEYLDNGTLLTIEHIPGGPRVSHRLCPYEP